MSEQEKQALITALRFLTASAKSRKTLKQKLEEKGYGEEIVEQALGRLEKQGLLNDRAYAQNLLQAYTTHRASGRRKVAFELEKRGINKKLTREVLESYSPQEEREKALEVAQLKNERWKNLDKMKRRKKLYDFLIRRGFEFDLCRDIVRQVTHE